MGPRPAPCAARGNISGNRDRCCRRVQLEHSFASLAPVSNLTPVAVVRRKALRILSRSPRAKSRVPSLRFLPKLLCESSCPLFPI